jgi:hypothetical protein
MNGVCQTEELIVIRDPKVEFTAKLTKPYVQDKFKVGLLMTPLYLIAYRQSSLYIQLLTSPVINEIVYTSEAVPATNSL